MSTDEKYKRSMDPRTKVVLLFLCVICALRAPALSYILCLNMGICIIGLYFHKVKYSLFSFLIYFIFYLVSSWVATMQGSFQIALLACLSLIHKVYSCGMLSGIFLSTTKASEFISGMYRLHIPEKVVIPMAVMLRYLPAIQEDWHYITDAMKLREVAPSLKNMVIRPLMVLECVYVPFMMSAARAADELTIAAVTRGIESPVKRTSLYQLHVQLIDYVSILCFLAYLILGICYGEVFL